MTGTRALVENIVPPEPRCGQMASVDLHIIYCGTAGSTIYGQFPQWQVAVVVSNSR